jgi:Cu/Ag efflux pump CusA
MTSFAFILGVYPLVVAQGAAEISRHDVGTPVFAGMIAATAIGLFVIPMLYVTFQYLRERSGAWLRVSYRLVRSRVAKKPQP